MSYSLPPDAFEKIMAVEGLYLDDEQKAMLAEFDRLGLGPDERRARILARYTKKPMRKHIGPGRICGGKEAHCLAGLGGKCVACFEED
jgi:hypothetical protein